MLSVSLNGNNSFPVGVTFVQLCHCFAMGRGNLLVSLAERSFMVNNSDDLSFITRCQGVEVRQQFVTIGRIFRVAKSAWSEFN